jgi:hypothetical protein
MTRYQVAPADQDEPSTKTLQTPATRPEPAAGMDRLLLDVVADGFVLYCCGTRTGPTALVVCYEWRYYLDIATIRDFDRVIAARVPKQGPVDVFAPRTVVWAYQAAAQPALRALLNLVYPAHPDAPNSAHPAPRALHIPRYEQRPLTIRLPTPDQVGVRAARLARPLLTGADVNRQDQDRERDQAYRA